MAFRGLGRDIRDAIGIHHYDHRRRQMLIMDTMATTAGCGAIFALHASPCQGIAPLRHCQQRSDLLPGAPSATYRCRGAVKPMAVWEIGYLVLHVLWRYSHRRGTAIDFIETEWRPQCALTAMLSKCGTLPWLKMPTPWQCRAQWEAETGGRVWLDISWSLNWPFDRVRDPSDHTYSVEDF